MSGAVAIWPDDRPPEGDYGGPLIGGWWGLPGLASEGVAPLPNPWADGDAVAAAEARVWEACQELVGPLAAVLGHHDERWWRWVLMPWLVHLGSIAEDVRAFISTASRDAPGLPVVRFPGPLQPPPTMGVGVALMRSSDHHRALVARVAVGMGLPTIDAAPADRDRTRAAAQEATRAPGPAVRLYTWARRVSADLRLAGGASDVAVIGHSGMTSDQARRLRQVTGARILTQRAGRPATPPASEPLRDRLAGLDPGGDDVRAVLARLLPSELPRSVAEAAAGLEPMAADVYGPPSHLVVGNYGADETMNAHIAASAATGHTVDHAQHGGYYLQARTNAQERLEIHPGSQFMAWRENPSPHLERIRGSHAGGTGVVVVEGLNPPDPFVLRFASTPLADQGYESANLLARFAAAAPELPLELRRFPRAGAVRPPSLEALPDSRETTGVAAIQRSRLAVLAYPDTPFVEALVIGAPTIGLWNPAHWELNAEAAAVFAALRDAGVVFGSPEDAAAQAAEVYPRASEWWSSDPVAGARAAFVDWFAPAGDWLAAWSAHLRAMPGRAVSDARSSG